MATSLTLGASGADVNPLLVESTAPHGAPQFTQITNEHYKPAFEQAVREARADIAAIVGNAQAPTFANTIEALEFSGRRLDRISNIFFNLNEAHTNDTMQALALELSPMLTEFSNDVSLDPKLFARVKAVYDRRESLGLNAEQRRLLEKTYKGFDRPPLGAEPSVQPKLAGGHECLYASCDRSGRRRGVARLRPRGHGGRGQGARARRMGRHAADSQYGPVYDLFVESRPEREALASL